jgi:hypothetical protein
MIRGFGLLFGCLMWTGPLLAQTVIRPDPPLDPTRAAVKDALLALRDSLTTIDGAAARLQRDFRQASGPSLLSRARVMEQACARSVRTIPMTRTVLLDAQLTQPRRVAGRRELLGSMDQLKGTLIHCQQEFAKMSAPGQAETVRGYANDRAARVQSSLRKYEASLRNFFGVMGIKFTPIGATSSTAAG